MMIFVLFFFRAGSGSFAARPSHTSLNTKMRSRSEVSLSTSATTPSSLYAIEGPTTHSTHSEGAASSSTTTRLQYYLPREAGVTTSASHSHPAPPPPWCCPCCPGSSWVLQRLAAATGSSAHQVRSRCRRWLAGGVAGLVVVGGGEGAEHQDQQGHGPGGGDEREDVDGLRGWSGYDSTAERDAVKWYEERAGAPGRTLRTSSSFRSRSEENKGKENDMAVRPTLVGAPGGAVGNGIGNGNAGHDDDPHPPRVALVGDVLKSDDSSTDCVAVDRDGFTRERSGSSCLQLDNFGAGQEEAGEQEQAQVVLERAANLENFGARRRRLLEEKRKQRLLSKQEETEQARGPPLLAHQDQQDDEQDHGASRSISASGSASKSCGHGAGRSFSAASILVPRDARELSGTRRPLPAAELLHLCGSAALHLCSAAPPEGEVLNVVPGPRPQPAPEVLKVESPTQEEEVDVEAPLLNYTRPSSIRTSGPEMAQTRATARNIHITPTPEIRSDADYKKWNAFSRWDAGKAAVETYAEAGYGGYMIAAAAGHPFGCIRPVRASDLPKCFPRELPESKARKRWGRKRTSLRQKKIAALARNCTCRGTPDMPESSSSSSSSGGRPSLSSSTESAASPKPKPREEHDEGSSSQQPPSFREKSISSSSNAEAEPLGRRGILEGIEGQSRIAAALQTTTSSQRNRTRQGTLRRAPAGKLRSHAGAIKEGDPTDPPRGILDVGIEDAATPGGTGTMHL